MKLERVLINVIWVVIGSILIILSFMGKVDSFWNGMGSSLLMIGIIQLIRYYRLYNNEVYREKLEIDASDERNHFLRNKAWAWAGYLFVFIAAFTSIVLKLVGYDMGSVMAALSAIVMIVLYCICYFFIKKKY